MKYAVYVEGKAEMLFVTDVLYKYSNYDPMIVGFKCINLNSDTFEYVAYPAQGEESTSRGYYQIVNVNNDSRVVSKLKQDIPNLMKQGFEIIIGLRDVFGVDYDNICFQRQAIDNGLIAQMHQAQSEQIKYDGVDNRLHFAVMEYETWMMALLDKYISKKGYDPIEVFAAAGVDYSSDFEQTIYHPSKKVQQIFKMMNSIYDKHESDQFAFLNCLEWEDYDSLYNSNRCASFRSFIVSLLNQ